MAKGRFKTGYDKFWVETGKLRYVAAGGFR